MGQYYRLACPEKKEYVSPYKLGTGAKLWEQINSFPSAGVAFMILCSFSEHRGGGDLNKKDVAVEKVWGRWWGCKVMMVGDYAEETDLPGVDIKGVWEKDGGYTDISDIVADAIEVACQGKYKEDQHGLKDFISDHGDVGFFSCECCRDKRKGELRKFRAENQKKVDKRMGKEAEDEIDETIAEGLLDTN